MKRYANNEERVSRIVAGDRQAITRTITMIENEQGDWGEVLSSLYARTGRAYRVGITGPPGAGKSTLVQRLLAHYREQKCNIAVIAIDPTSPFSGGAILGDRVRMQSESMHNQVFIRSMATRGSLGGMSTRAHDVADLLDAAGFDLVILETVGVGQSELEIADAADTTVVVLVPESGDSIQAMKSGLMEIADLFVVNKADREGADQAVAALKTILTFRITHDTGEWITPVVKTTAATGAGVPDLADLIARHRDWLEESHILASRRFEREKRRARELTERLVGAHFWTTERLARFERFLPDLEHRVVSPLQIARMLMD